MSTENSEKKKALEAAMGQIEKQFGKGSVMKLGEFQAMNIEAIPTGALGLDIALGIGGVPRGRIIEVFGPESSRKNNACITCSSRSTKSRRRSSIYRCRTCIRSSICKTLRGRYR